MSSINSQRAPGGTLPPGLKDRVYGIRCTRSLVPKDTEFYVEATKSLYGLEKGEFYLFSLEGEVITKRTRVKAQAIDTRANPKCQSTEAFELGPKESAIFCTCFNIHNLNKSFVLSGEAGFSIRHRDISQFIKGNCEKSRSLISAKTLFISFDLDVGNSINKHSFGLNLPRIERFSKRKKGLDKLRAGSDVIITIDQNKETKNWKEENHFFYSLNRVHEGDISDSIFSKRPAAAAASAPMSLELQQPPIDLGERRALQQAAGQVIGSLATSSSGRPKRKGDEGKRIKGKMRQAPPE